MKVSNMIGHSGEEVKNQFEIIADNGDIVFQSYNSVIAKKTTKGIIYLDADKWDYSTTTGKYRNIFLRENKANTMKKIKDGVYILTNLNN